MTDSFEMCSARSLAGQLYDNAKWWTGLSSVLAALGLLAGILSTFDSVPSEPIPFVVAGLTIVGAIVSQFARGRYASGEWLQRKLDIQDSFGITIPQREWMDLLARCPESLKSRANVDAAGNPFFASRQPVGAQKAYENLMESAWWSKHLARSMATLLFCTVALSVVMAIAALIGAIELAPSIDENKNVSREGLSEVASVVTSLLMFLITLRLASNAWGFLQFSWDAERCETAAGTAIAIDAEKPARPEAERRLDAIRLWHDYQIARATAPVLPTWLWKLRQKNLNQLWKNQLEPTTSVPPKK